MNHARFWVATGIIAIVIAISFVFSVPHTEDVYVEPLQNAIQETPAITIRDSYRKGVHTITGSLVAPNACTKLSASSSLIGDASTTQRILVAVSYGADAGICLQLPTKTSFETQITAPPSLPIDATVNGAMASTTRS